MKTIARIKAVPRTVDFANNDNDLECAILGEAGWYTKAIARETGLSESQVNYRLGAARIRRASYRNGHSEMANFILGQLRMRTNVKKRVRAANQLPAKIDALQAQYAQALADRRKK